MFSDQEIKYIRGPRLVLSASKRKVKTLPQPYVSRTKTVYIGYILKSSDVNSCPKQKAQEKDSK